jgi:hypothetical protein
MGSKVDQLEKAVRGDKKEKKLDKHISQIGDYLTTGVMKDIDLEEWFRSEDDQLSRIASIYLKDNPGQVDISLARRWLAYPRAEVRERAFDVLVSLPEVPLDYIIYWSDKPGFDGERIAAALGKRASQLDYLSVRKLSQSIYPEVVTSVEKERNKRQKSALKKQGFTSVENPEHLERL